MTHNKSYCIPQLVGLQQKYHKKVLKGGKIIELPNKLSNKIRKLRIPPENCVGSYHIKDWVYLYSEQTYKRHKFKRLYGGSIRIYGKDGYPVVGKSKKFVYYGIYKNYDIKIIK